MRIAHRAVFAAVALQTTAVSRASFAQPTNLGEGVDDWAAIIVVAVGILGTLVWILLAIVRAVVGSKAPMRLWVLGGYLLVGPMAYFAFVASDAIPFGDEEFLLLSVFAGLVVAYAALAGRAFKRHNPTL